MLLGVPVALRSNVAVPPLVFVAFTNVPLATLSVVWLELFVPFVCSVIGEDALIVWLGHVPVIETLVPATSAGDAVPVPPCATANTPLVSAA